MMNRLRIAYGPVLVMTSCLAATTASAYVRPVDPSPTRVRNAHAVERLERVEKLIKNAGVPSLLDRGVWWRLLEHHRERIEDARTHTEFADALNELLDRTEQSHFRYYHDDQWAYWLMRSFFFRHDETVEFEHVGLYTELIDDRWFVRGLFDGSEAASKGIHIGDEVVSVNDEPFDPVLSFRGKADERVTVRLRRRPGQVYRVTMTPVKESLYRAVQRAIRKSIRVIEFGGVRMAYMHGWTLLGPGGEYDLLAELQPDVDGLLLDYRDGVGGSPGNAKRFLLGSRSSNRMRDPHWTKPLVILTGNGTRSAKEIVVDAVQDAARALLIGSPTPGHVTACIARRVGGDGVLILPVKRLALEGLPTKPDIYVKRKLPYCDGYDPQMKIAKLALQELVQRERDSISSN